MPSPLPRHSDWDHSCSLTQSYQPSPKWRSGRPVQPPFRGFAQRSLALRPAHSRCHLYAARFTGGFNRFVTSAVAPVASDWNSSRVGLTPTGENAALPRRTPEAAFRVGLVWVLIFVVYGCMSPLADRYLPAVLSITERGTEYLYRVVRSGIW